MSRDKEREIQQFTIDLQNTSQKATKIITDETANYVKENHKYNNLVDYAKAHIKSRFEYEAEFLTELGYAKTSEVALKVIGEVEKIIDKYYNRHIFGVEDLSDVEQEAVMNFSDDITGDLAELKKKYMESEKDNGD